MIRDELVDSIAEYFHSDHWRNLVDMLEKTGDEKVYHAHIYWDTSVHPCSLEPLVRECFRKIGHPVDRVIEIYALNPKRGTLHGIEPRGLPHFDIVWRFNNDVLVAPMPNEEAPHHANLAGWGKDVMSKFLAQFQFREVGAEERKQIDEYFTSPTWAKYLDLVEDPAVVHVHANVELGIHPDELVEPALKTMDARKWQGVKVEPCIFDARGEVRGKIVFLAQEPEKVYDIAWVYNKDVGVRAASDYFLVPDDPTLDIRTTETLSPFLQADPYKILSKIEIKEIAKKL